MKTSIHVWLKFVFFAVLLMIALGGATRLTGSGLSIVDWRPVTGTIPPLSQQDWEAEFAKYQNSPEFKLKNFALDLDGFKKIFFWEYVHRLWGRLLGFFLFIPGIYFWRKGQLPVWLKRRLLLLIALLAAQGLMGWIMVKSGLLHDPQVSHFRLAMHFMLAVFILSILRWTAWEAQIQRKPFRFFQISFPLNAFLLLAIGQLIYGAFLAGTKAGWAFSTFPTMNGAWFPPDALTMNPLVLNFFENGIFIHWFHRLLGTILLATAWILFYKNKEPLLQKPYLHLVGVLSTQYVLGILTVMLHVPVVLGVLHQLVAVVFFIAILKIIFVEAK